MWLSVNPHGRGSNPRYDDKTKPTLNRRLGISITGCGRGGPVTAVEATLPKNWPNVAKADHFGPKFGHLGNLKKVLLQNSAFSPGTHSGTKNKLRN